MAGLLEVNVLERREWSPTLITLTVDHAPTFAPGQFFNLALKSDDEPTGLLRRSYSAASAPGAPLEFVISQVKEGALTPSLFALEPRSKVLLDATPLGFFTLNEVPETKRLWLVATGTGLGPYISMLRSGLLKERFEQVIVVHGVRSADNLCYQKELEDTQKEGRIVYVPVLSGPDQGSAHTVPGRITSAWDAGLLEEKAGVFDPDCHMLMCGNPQMIDDMTERLKARGFEKHRRKKAGHFNFERYW